MLGRGRETLARSFVIDVKQPARPINEAPGQVGCSRMAFGTAGMRAAKWVASPETIKQVRSN